MKYFNNTLPAFKYDAKEKMNDPKAGWFIEQHNLYSKSHPAIRKHSDQKINASEKAEASLVRTSIKQKLI